MAMRKFSTSSAAFPPSVCENPHPFPFLSKVKKMDKVYGPDTHKSEWIKLEFLMDPDIPESLTNYSRQFSIFMSRCSDEWIKWVMAFREIENLMPWKEPAYKTSIFRTLLKGQALSYFEHHLMRMLEAEDSDIPDNDIMELVFRDIGLEYIPKCAICI
jgi:hypothetical protein